MPEINGDEILEALAEKGRLQNAKILVSSSIKPPGSIWRNFQQYDANFVSKDDLYDKSAFLSILENLVNSPT